MPVTDIMTIVFTVQAIELFSRMETPRWGGAPTLVSLVLATGLAATAGCLSFWK